ncbi:ECF RNA polymerase sigma factor RpoE [Saliniradius amylolyticus]|uniref:ECF RNA polymerase sigma factor RpoE n=1 Tax=Saliniradius amylolyticus TaxID=2183582 RepID=A0A2S2E4U2_9ALTE|nr:sigma-70 family RNA polymerase sigma factor [Saliniradius amylolyticus]AWL12653.1 ECF RNA polymerase sigma factor RpoE [Saliniradius amylolyticus]
MLVGIQLQSTKSQPQDSGDLKADMAAMLQKVADERCKASFARLFNHFAPRIRSYALKQFGNEAQAMELVQDTLSNVWQKAHLFNASKGAPSTWIFTIARNIRFDMLRKQQNRKEDICSDDLWPVLCEQTAEPNEVDMDEQMTLHQVGEMFSSLPEKQRLVIEAIYVEGKSQQEVADQLSIPLGTVKSRTRLALQRLKEMLDHDE